jgi:CDP-diacylglycerol--serine O-phosphatidyltransferase
MLAFVVGLRTTLDTVCLAGFICSGLARLARFNATVALIPKDEAGKSRYFEGLPIPSTLLIVALLTWWTKMGWIVAEEGVPLGMVNLWKSETGAGELHLVSLLFGVWAAMMVSKTLHVPKL